MKRAKERSCQLEPAVLRGVPVAVHDEVELQPPELIDFKRFDA
jgi:hypothetical protein